MDLSKLYNPYDFANPVSNRDLFVGRVNELREIKYYLDHAKQAPRPINLALIGARASGKTSVLNMIEIEAEERDFCVVRVDLDEAVAETQLAFFYKLFDCILISVCQLDAYGGLHGKTYDTYRSMVDAYEIPEDRTFCPFIFPIQYAKAMSVGNTAAALSDTSFKLDLNSVQKAVNRPIAILFDECDVLTKSRVHLEKICNIFMNTSGFMLVFTGTPALFPLMDDVFSPIIRQFKKISIVPFTERDETKTCIRRPLETIGIDHPSEIFDLETYHDVSEIHNLSGGRPYEIQLICHFLFRRIQEERAKRMELTLDVLEDVRRELEMSQNVATRRVLTVVQGFNKQRLAALHLLCKSIGLLTFEQIWFNEYLFHGESRWTKTALQDVLRLFKEAGVVTVKDDIVEFAGDDFDRIYCKYLARKHEVPLFIGEDPLELLLAVNLDGFIRTNISKEIESVHVIRIGESGSKGIIDTVNALMNEDEKEDPFESIPSVAHMVYWASMDFRHSLDFHVASVSITTPWIMVTPLYKFKGSSEERACLVGDFGFALQNLSERAHTLGGDVKVEIHTLSVIPSQILIKKVEQSDNARMRRELAAEHIERLIETYLERHSLEEAIFHGEVACRYDTNPSPSVANNLGYIFLVSNELRKARELLEVAVKNHKEPAQQALPTYNLGIVEAKEGNLESALERFRLAIELATGSKNDERETACLIRPKIAEEGGILEYQELMEPDLLETAKSAAATVEAFLRSRQ